MKVGKIFILIAAQFSLLISITAQPQWELTGELYGGDIRNIAQSPNGTLYAGLQNGSLYKKETTNDYWELVFGKSNEYGNYGFPGILIINDSLIITSSMGRGTRKSTDGGFTWQYLNLGYGSLSINDSNHIFHLGYWSCDDLSVSTDLGDTWQTYALNCQAGWVGEVGFAKHDSLWIIGSHDGMLFSSDQGINWEQRNSGIPIQTYVYSVLVNTSDDIYIGTDASLYYSNNYGQTWVFKGAGLPTGCTVTDLVELNDSTIYAATKHGLYFTTDAGDSWNSYTPNTEHLLIYKMIPFKDSFLLSTTESLILPQEDSLSYFDEGISDIEVSGLYEYENRLYAVTNRGIHYFDGVLNEWRFIKKTRKTSFSNITYSENNLFTTSGNILYNSENGLTEWASKTLPARCYSLLATGDTLFTGMIDYDPLWGPPSWEDLHYSTDLGSTWHKKNVSGIEYARIYFIGNSSLNDLYFIAYNVSSGDDYIYQSTNGGASFHNFNQGFPSYISFGLRKIITDINGKLYLASENGLFHRLQSDSIWTQTGIEDNIYDITSDSAGGLYYTTSDKVFYSDDFGLSSTTLNLGLPEVKAISIYYSKINDLLYLGTDKGVYKTQRPNITSVDIKSNDIPTDFGLTSYPNPFNSSTVISFSLPERSYIKITIYNSIGKKVKDLLKIEMEAGNHELTFSAADLPSGIYFCRMDSGKFSRTIKLALLK